MTTYDPRCLYCGAIEAEHEPVAPGPIGSGPPANNGDRRCPRDVEGYPDRPAFRPVGRRRLASEAMP
jgi:hypothetical protein